MSTRAERLVRGLLLSWVALCLCGSRPSAASGRPPKPNVLLVLTDDLGWQDVKCYDVDEPSPYQTANINALEKGGVQFWQAYASAPTCSPTRCAILSGKSIATYSTTALSAEELRAR